MSGGVGPTCDDISLPKEQEQGSKLQQDLASDKNTVTRRHGHVFLSFRHLNCLALIVVLAASGLVSLEDFGFVVFSVGYMYFISKVAFPPTNQPGESLVFDPSNKVLRYYVLVSALVGLFLPIVYIFEGVFKGDKDGIRAAASHLFLLASQVFMEGVAYSGRFSLPVFVFVPVFYNSRRIFTIVDWLRSEVYKVDEEVYGGSRRRLFMGRALAVANMAFWCFNLFGFLLPVYLPKAFKKYYSASKVKDSI